MSDWIAVDKPWDEFTNASAGVQIEVRRRNPHVKTEFLSETEFYLIGELNELGGVCDDCQGIRHNDIVLRYRVLVDASALEGKI